MFSTATSRVARSGLVAGLVSSLSISLAGAAVPKQDYAFLDHKAFFRPELYISSTQSPLADIIDQLPNRAALEAFTARRAADGSTFHVFIDPRSGAAVNVMGAVPLIPGRGVGNRVTLESLGTRLGRTVEAVDAAAVGDAVLAYVNANRDVLGIDVTQLGAVRATQVSDELWQVSIPQAIDGIPVRHGRIAASISHGNLVTIGTEAWGNVSPLARPSVTAEQAVEAGFAYLEGRTGHDEMLAEPRLEIIPFAPAEFRVGEGFEGPVGRGYGHYLVWTFEFQRPPELARWEVRVNAHTGEVLAVEDTNQYVERGFTGGVYPVTSTGICPDAGRCGIMQTGWPMPFANTGFAAPNNFTNSAGIYDYSSGTATTSLAGRFVRMVDSCGAVNESSATGAINLGGANNQHDCTSGGSSAGNTPASRSGFYELNKLAEQARGWLPSNAWLNAQLVSNMNLNQTCNAFWGGGTVNFYRSGGGCRNTGEIAAVFDHEWGHGLDDNDAAGALSSSSEGYADIAAIYRLQTSCVGYGFFQTLNDGCGQTADGTGFNTNEAQQGAAHCDTDCSGVRDADWAKHSPSTPDTPANFVCTSCLVSSGLCGRQTHCAAAPSRQAAWDLVTRDLTAAPFSLDSQSAFIVGNKVFYQGSGNIGAWHGCTCPSTSSGCATANGYMQWITADDDNGNLNDGTPHMTAIFNAFNRHGIACATPAAQNSGCAGGPTAASNLTVTPGSFSASLSWTAVAGATRYWVFRSEGHAGCNFGKALIATVNAPTLTFTDTQLANGRTYYYNVVGVGASAACYGRVSNCANVTPQAGTNPDFSIACNPSSLSIQQGNSGNSTCTVTSTGGFASAVGLTCANLPAGTTCSFNPSSVTPAANGSVNSTLTVSVGGGTTPNNYTIQAVGTSGALTRSANIGLTVTAAPTPNFSVAAAPSTLSVAQGASGNSTITVASTNGFNSAVTLTTSTLPSGVTAGFATNPVTPPANGSATSVLTFTATASAATGTFPITITGTSGALVRTASISLTITQTGGGGDLTASFDAARQAPSCGTTVGRSCDTGTSLVMGRANLGPEPNQPNTIADSCADGTAGTFHSDESNDRIRVFTTDGTNFAPGKTVTIQATVWAWTSPAQDAADFFYAANANSPTWTFIGTVVPTVVGAQNLSVNYTLPTGGTQAVRVQFRYQSSAAACAAGTFNDRDDLVFAVTSTPVTTVFSDNFETANGWVTNPNGTDTATTGQWERGDPEATTDGGARQLGTTTSGVNDLVTARLAGASAGANDIDGGVTTIHSPLITLPATGNLSLSFQYYLAHSTNSSNLDFFRAFVVVGPNATQVFQSLGAATNRNGVWTGASASLNAFAGQTVRIRFEAADASTASLVEAGVDDVVITQQ
jgi:trimeric autotransporter adhesin